MSDRDERPQEVLSHLQAAANELIKAARVVIDIAEEVVSEGVRRVSEGGRTAPSPPPPVEKIEVVREDPPEP